MHSCEFETSYTHVFWLANYECDGKNTANLIFKVKTKENDF